MRTVSRVILKHKTYHTVIYEEERYNQHIFPST